MTFDIDLPLLWSMALHWRKSMQSVRSVVTSLWHTISLCGLNLPSRCFSKHQEEVRKTLKYSFLNEALSRTSMVKLDEYKSATLRGGILSFMDTRGRELLTVFPGYLSNDVRDMRSSRLSLQKNSDGQFVKETQGT